MKSPMRLLPSHQSNNSIHFFCCHTHAIRNTMYCLCLNSHAPTFFLQKSEKKVFSICHIFFQVYGCKNISFWATYLFSSTKVWMCQVTLLMDASLCAANIYLEKPQRGNDWCSLLCSFPRKKPLNTYCTYLLFLWFIPYDLPTINAVKETCHQNVWN